VRARERLDERPERAFLGARRRLGLGEREGRRPFSPELGQEATAIRARRHVLVDARELAFAEAVLEERGEVIFVQTLHGEGAPTVARALVRARTRASATITSPSAFAGAEASA
jgi:hypothetical protein